MKLSDKVKLNFENLIIPIILAILSFYDFNRGIDLTDAGYSMHYFQYFDMYEGAATIPLFWSNVLGNFFTKLPWGDTWSGLSFWCTFVIAASVVSAYFFCKKYMDYRMVAVAEALAICFCWAPNVILYDYVSFFLLQAGGMFLFRAIEKEQKIWYVVAGLVLGINLFVRIPNVTHCAALVIVWLAGWKNKKKLKEIILDTALCVSGYAVSAVVSLFLIIQKFGFEELRVAIYRLFHTSQTQEGYGILYMATALILEILKYSKYIIVLLAVLFIGALIASYMLKNEKSIRSVQVTVSGVTIGLFVFWMLKDGLFGFDFTLIDSILGLAGIFLLWSFLVSIWNLFAADKLEEKLLALTFIGVFYITPLGSNNHIYLAVMNMFLLIPLGIYQIMLWKKVIVKIKKDVCWSGFEKIYTTIIGTVGVIMLLQTVLFGMNYIYKDTEECIVTADNMLKGTCTSVVKEQELAELILYFEEEELTGDYGVLYCDAPSLAYILELKPVLSSPWPDLFTYSYDDFFEGLKKVEYLIEDGDAPVFLINNAYSYYMDGNTEGLQEAHIAAMELSIDDKYFRLKKFLYDNQYVPTYRTASYAVYQKQ